MQTRSFGNTGLNVSILGFGAGHVGGDDLSEAESELLLNSVLDEGITLVDTARGYGRSEERIGRYLGYRRSEFVLSTKVGYGVEGYDDWTPEIIPAGIERALKLLQTDVIDIVHLHSCPLDTLKNSGVPEALAKCKESGKIRVAAYSGENDALAWAVESGLFGSIQTSVNVTDQWSLKNCLSDAASRGMGVIAKRPIANAPWKYSELPSGEYVEEYWKRWKTMNVDAGDLPWSEVFLRFAAYAPGVSTAIVGTASLDHLKANIAEVSKGPLPEELLGRIGAAFVAQGADWGGEI